MDALRKAAEQALEALERHGCAYLHHTEQYGAAITALRAALAEQEQAEPVATVENGTLVRSNLPPGYTGHLYAHPPRREQDDAETTALRAEVERLRADADSSVRLVISAAESEIANLRAEVERLREEITQMKKFPPPPLVAKGCPVCGLGSQPGTVTNYACTRGDCPIRVTCGG